MKLLRGLGGNELSGQGNGVQRPPQVVAQYTKKDLLPPLDLGRVRLNRLCQCLVDRFVEAANVSHRIGAVRGFIGPKAQDAGPQRAVFGEYLFYAQAAARPQKAMDFSGRLRLAVGSV